MQRVVELGTQAIFILNPLHHHGIPTHYISISFIQAINFVILFSRQGKCRLKRFYNTYTTKEKGRIVNDMVSMILPRKQLGRCSILEWKEKKIIYRKFVVLLSTLFPNIQNTLVGD